MKLFQLNEVKYAGKQPWFVLDEIEGETQIIGPFQSRDVARKYIDNLEQNFGELVAFTASTATLSTPEDYYESVRQHYEWMNED